MYGFAVNLIVSVSGHPWIINEINFFQKFSASQRQLGTAEGGMAHSADVMSDDAKVLSFKKVTSLLKYEFCKK